MSEEEKDDTGPKGTWGGTIPPSEAPGGKASINIVIEKVRKNAEQAKEDSGGVPLHIDQGPEIPWNEDGDGEDREDGENKDEKEDDPGTSQTPFKREIGDLLGQPLDGSPQEQDDGYVERDTSWGTDADAAITIVDFTI
jgi:hypothetical protein